MKLNAWLPAFAIVLAVESFGPKAAVCLADPVPTPTAQLDPGFLLLPAFDIDRVPSPTPSKKADSGETAKVGDPLVLRIQSVALPGITEPSRELRIEVPPGTEDLTDQGWEVGAIQDGVPVGEFRLKVVPLKSGNLTLPSLALQDLSGKSIARTNPFNLTVQSAIRTDDPKPEQPEDMQPPVSLRFPWWLIVAAALAFLALVGLSIYGYRRWARSRKRVKPAKPVAPPKPEDEIALAALAELERQGPLKRGEFKAHYFRVSEILKTYIGARYRFDAAESTTREMISQLEEKHELADQQIDRLESVFEKLDLVKFTDHVPLPDEGLRLVEFAREFVQTTRRPPPLMQQEGAVR